MLFGQMLLILLLTLNRSIPIPPALLAILVIILSEIADYLVVASFTLVINMAINMAISRLMSIIPGPFQMFIRHPTSLAFPFFDLSAGRTLGGPLAASLDDGSSPSALKVTIKKFFGYTLDRREALRYLSSLPHALMSPVLMKACYGDIFFYRSQSNVYLKTVWAALKMAVGETLTQEQVNVLLPGIPSSVFSVAQDDICPAITRRLSIILITGVGLIAMIILACLSLQALLKKVLGNISASTQGSTALDPLPSSALPNPPLQDEHRPSLPVPPASGRDVVAVSSTESDPVSDDEAFVYPDHSKGSTSSTPTNALAASLKKDEHHPSPVASGSGIVAANSPRNDPEPEEEVFTYIDQNQSKESTSTLEGCSIVEGFPALPKSCAVQESLVQEATTLQSSTIVEGSSAAIRSETMAEDIAQSSTAMQPDTPDGRHLQTDLSGEGTVVLAGPSGVSELGSTRSGPTLEEFSTARDVKLEGTAIGSELIAEVPGPSHIQTDPMPPISPGTLPEPDDDNDEVLQAMLKEFEASRKAREAADKHRRERQRSRGKR